MARRRGLRRAEGRRRPQGRRRAPRRAAPGLTLRRPCELRLAPYADDVTSALAASALSRRYLLGPLLALALVGANPGQVPSGGVPLAGSSATPTASPASEVADAG